MPKPFSDPCLILLAVLMAWAGLAVPAFGQPGDPTPGYYIDRNGVRTDGYFPKGVRQNNLNGFLFSETPTGRPDRVPLDSALTLYLGPSEQYRIQELREGEKTEYLTLRKLVEADAALYVGSSSLKGGTLFLIREAQGDEYLVTRRTFEGVKRVLARSCEALDEEAYAFREKDLIALTVAHNTCRGAPATVLVEPGKAQFSAGLRAYGYWSDLIVPESNFYGLGDYETDLGVSVAAHLAWLISARVRLLVEVGYFHLLSRSSFVNVTPRDNLGTYAEVTFDMKYLEVPLLVQYGIPMGQFRPFVEGGLYMGIPLSREFSEELTFADASHNQYTPEVSFTDANFGYTLGLGAGWQLTDRLELALVVRWAQAGSQMRTSSSANAAPEIGFTNLRTDKLSGGLRLDWRL